MHKRRVGIVLQRRGLQPPTMSLPALENDAQVGGRRFAATRGSNYAMNRITNFVDLLQRNQGIDHEPGSGARDR